MEKWTEPWNWIEDCDGRRQEPYIALAYTVGTPPADMRKGADTVCGNFMRMRKFSTTSIEFYTYICQIVDIYMTVYSEMLNISSEH